MKIWINLLEDEGHWLDISASINPGGVNPAYIYSIMQNHFYKPFMFNGELSFRCRGAIQAINPGAMVLGMLWWRGPRVGQCCALIGKGGMEKKMAAPKRLHPSNPLRLLATGWHSSPSLVIRRNIPLLLGSSQILQMAHLASGGKLDRFIRNFLLFPHFPCFSRSKITIHSPELKVKTKYRVLY